VVEARDGLRRVLAAIHRGELTADSGYVARLEGAIAALDALLGEPANEGRPEAGTLGRVGVAKRAAVRVRRVYQMHEPDDGARILVDRLWPRGLTKTQAELDEWCKDVAPSTDLRTWYGHDPTRFKEFARRYRVELEQPERSRALAHLRELAKDRNLTLLTATKDPEISAAEVLATMLRG